MMFEYRMQMRRDEQVMIEDSEEEEEGEVEQVVAGSSVQPKKYGFTQRLRALDNFHYPREKWLEEARKKVKKY